MKIKGIHLAWIVVKDLKAAIEFYTKTVGLTLRDQSPEYGWAELSGPDGSMLGVAQENPHMEIEAGKNAVVTITVDDIEETRKFLLKQGANMIGEIMEVPGHVKMQTFTDADGNMMQMVQKLD